MGRKICCAAALAAVVLCILFFPERTRAVPAEEYLTQKRPEYQGVIEFWQVSGWRTAAMPRSSAASQACARFEASHPGVYVEFEEITEEKLQNRLRAGRLPDLLSVPAEMIPEGIEAGAWDMPELYTRFQEDFGMAVPWMATAGVVIVGQAGEGAAAAEQWSLPFDASGRGIGAQRTQTDRQAYTKFVSGEVGTLYGGLWEEAALARREEKVAYQIFPFPEDLPMPVQFQYLIAPFAKDGAKSDCLKELMEEFLGETTQKTVAERCGVLPVVSPMEDWKLGEAQRVALERLQGAYCYLSPGSVMDEAGLSGGKIDPDCIRIVPEVLQEDGD